MQSEFGVHAELDVLDELTMLVLRLNMGPVVLARLNIVIEDCRIGDYCVMQRYVR